MPCKLILLIDNETSVREILRSCLCDIGGWKVTAVASPQEGRERIGAECPDAILLDVPDLESESMAFLAQLRSEPAMRSIPVLLVTAKARWFSPKQLREFGVTGTIAKPFDPLTVPIQVAGILGWSLGFQTTP